MYTIYMDWRSQESHIWGCYLGIRNMGRTVLGNRMYMYITAFTVLKTIYQEYINMKMNK